MVTTGRDRAFITCSSQTLHRPLCDADVAQVQKQKKHQLEVSGPSKLAVHVVHFLVGLALHWVHCKVGKLHQADCMHDGRQGERTHTRAGALAL
jgi:hypothetical protein